MDTSDNDNEVIVIPEKEARFTQRIIIGEHQLAADEPIAMGGHNLGPSPYGLLLASLGACTAMTLKMYAELKKIPLQNVVVRLMHTKTHATDCINCEDKNVKIDQIEREIELEGPLSQEQKDRLLYIANRCPVHQTLTSKIIIHTELV